MSIECHHQLLTQIGRQIKNKKNMCWWIVTLELRKEDEYGKGKMCGIGRRNEELNKGMGFSPNITFLLLFHFIKAPQRLVQIGVSLTCVVPILHPTSSTLLCSSNRCHCLLHHLAHQLQTSSLLFPFGPSLFTLQLPPSLSLLCIPPNHTNPKIKFKTHFASPKGFAFCTPPHTHQPKTSPHPSSRPLLHPCLSSIGCYHRTLQHSRQRRVSPSATVTVRSPLSLNLVAWFLGEKVEPHCNPYAATHRIQSCQIVIVRFTIGPPVGLRVRCFGNFFGLGFDARAYILLRHTCRSHVGGHVLLFAPRGLLGCGVCCDEVVGP